MSEPRDVPDTDRDPTIGTPGAHPGATGPRAAVEGIGGDPIAVPVNPTVEDAYWCKNYQTRPYVKPDQTYNSYRPAYQLGWESRTRHAGRSWDDAEGDIAKDWAKRQSRLSWDEAGPATRDAWDRASEPRR